MFEDELQDNRNVKIVIKEEPKSRYRKRSGKKAPAPAEHIKAVRSAAGKRSVKTKRKKKVRDIFLKQVEKAFDETPIEKFSNELVSSMKTMNVDRLLRIIDFGELLETPASDLAPTDVNRMNDAVVDHNDLLNQDDDVRPTLGSEIKAASTSSIIMDNTIRRNDENFQSQSNYFESTRAENQGIVFL